MWRFAPPLAAAMLAASGTKAATSPPVIGYVAAFKGFDRIVEQADFSRYTHVDLAFVNPDAAGRFAVEGQLVCAPDADRTNLSPEAVLRMVAKARKAGAKVLVSIGGAVIPACSGDWEELLAPRTRGQVVAELLRLVDDYGFDGVDIDLEGDLMMRIDRAGNYTPFVAALSAALKARKKLLTCATTSFEGGMVPESALRHFDVVSIMSYDAAGPTWGEPGSEHSPYWRAERDMRLWIAKGVPRDKLALGVPFYGWGFGRYRRAYAFRQIAAEFGPAAIHSDVVGQRCAGCDYITYNGLVTLRRKASLAGAWGAGVMVWEIHQDTPDHLLIRTVVDALQTSHARSEPSVR